MDPWTIWEKIIMPLVGMLCLLVFTYLFVKLLVEGIYKFTS